MSEEGSQNDQTDVFALKQPTMSVSDLERCVHHARYRMAKHGSEWMFAMPLYVFLHFFGEDWVNLHLFKGGFLSPPLRHLDRVRQQQVGSHGYLLAENLYNLQNVEGFPDVYERMLKGQIEACNAELEVSRLIRLRGQAFRFVPPLGRTGENYDIELLKRAETICCEAKCRLEVKDLTAHVVWRRLDDARKQLPKGKPGVIFLRVAGDHTRNGIQAKAAVVQPGVEKLFRQTRRIIGVILVTRMFEGAEDDFTVRHMWRTIPNKNTSAPVPLLDLFPHQSIKEPSTSWTYLVEYRPCFLFEWA